MVTVITYETFDLLHHGHIRLLERAKTLGDYLIVGVTADDYDKTRGKINVQQSLMERIEAVRATGLADKIIVEEYEGQKIDDILRYNVDIFTVGSDWKGQFDYLDVYCKVIYLERTEGVSSSELRTEKNNLRVGLVGEVPFLEKFYKESSFVNGLEVAGVFTDNPDLLREHEDVLHFVKDYHQLLDYVDAVYIASHPSLHYTQIKEALCRGKHVLCESPSTLSVATYTEVCKIAADNGLILMDAIKTAYSTAYNRLLVLLQSGKIGKVLSVDATCTSLKTADLEKAHYKYWNSICDWGPTAMLPVFQILGTNWEDMRIVSLISDQSQKDDLFTKIDFRYRSAVASIKVGKGAKSEGELIITGTQGYIYVPAPWWKMDYFEVRYENQQQNKRYFYQLDGEGIRYELFAFVTAVAPQRRKHYINEWVSSAIIEVIESFESGNVNYLQ